MLPENEASSVQKQISRCCRIAYKNVRTRNNLHQSLVFVIPGLNLDSDVLHNELKVRVHMM